MNESSKVLGIDPGSRKTGYGLIMFNQKPILIKAGTIETKGDHNDRLKSIFYELKKIIEEHKPDVIAIEKVFVHKNADSALKLGQARAAALSASFNLDLPIFEYAAKVIKKAVVGSGNADKSQVQHMIKILFALKDDPKPDTADALAVALCHSNQSSSKYFKNN